MSVGGRVREERQRLGLSQPAFAGLAGATKGAQAKWEKDEASPNAKALIAWEEAGADATYILTGLRRDERRADAVLSIKEQLSAIRRDLLDTSRRKFAEESEEEAEARVLTQSRNALKAILNYDSAMLTPDLANEVEHLLDVVENPAGLALYRAADFAILRKKRTEVRERLVQWFDDGPYQPNETVTKSLANLVIEYQVPVKVLVELGYEFFSDITSCYNETDSER